MDAGLLASVLAFLSLASGQPGCAGREQRLGTANRTYVATVIASARAYRRPGGPLVRRFGKVGIDGGPQVLGVVGEVLGPRCDRRWLRVQLPIRPNGATGYVRAYAVRVTTV